MVAAIGAVGSYQDAEYTRILKELMQAGLTSSGNKSADKSRLNQAKLELIQKIQTKQAEEVKQDIQVQPLEATQNSQHTPQMEQERVGAMTLAELNKISEDEASDIMSSYDFLVDESQYGLTNFSNEEVTKEKYLTIKRGSQEKHNR